MKGRLSSILSLFARCWRHHWKTTTGIQTIPTI